MGYLLGLFSPETHERFSKSDRSVYGTRKQGSSKVKAGDKLLCYVTGHSCWAGLLVIQGGAFQDATPIFAAEDPFVDRFKVQPVVWLPTEEGLSIYDKTIWSTLSVTKGYSPAKSRWTGPFRRSLNRLPEADGAFLEKLLVEHPKAQPKAAPLKMAKIETAKIEMAEPQTLIVKLVLTLAPAVAP